LTAPLESHSRRYQQSLRDRLLAVLEASDVVLDEHEEETSLIQSGKLDSLGLFNLALFVESQIGSKVDVTAFDLAKEWNTVNDILKFIARFRE
jgi:acyl carrier protein